jgi:serine protease Do
MKNGARTVALSAVTSLLVSSFTLAAGSSYLRAQVPSLALQDLSDLEDVVEEESPVINVVKSAEPAVVSVIISKDLPVLERTYERLPFGFIIPRVEQRGTERLEVGGGTAFFVSPDGLLLTNKHVVNDANAQYSVLLNDGRTLNASVVARDTLTDIALLKVDGNGFPYLTLSSTDDPTLGQSVIAIGNALAEFRNTVSLGVISGLQRTITAGNPSEGTVEQLSRIIQTDAAINEGNSGGPLLNLRGEVIGMNTAVASEAQNIGFAIPVGDLQRAFQSYLRYGRIVRPYIGVRYILITPKLAQDENLPYDYGVLVAGDASGSDQAIIPESPADKAGLKVGDIILEADGQKLTEDMPLGDIVQRKQPGDTVTLKIARQGKEQTLGVTLDEWRE